MKIKEISQDQMVEGKHYTIITIEGGETYTSTIRLINGGLEIYEFYEGIWIDTEIVDNDKILEIKC